MELTYTTLYMYQYLKYVVEYNLRTSTNYTKYNKTQFCVTQNGIIISFHVHVVTSDS